MNERISDLVDQVENGLNGLAQIMATPDTVAFAHEREHFERLERILAQKPVIDAAFAYLANLHQAGRIVGGVRPEDYLSKNLDISRSEASTRVRRGEELFAPVPEPEKEQPEPEETEEQRLAREKEERRRQEAAEKARERSRKRKAVNEEKRKIIDGELRQVSEHARPGVDELRDLALAESPKRSPEDLRRWLRDQVKTANAKGRKPNGKKDRHAAYKKRYLSFGQQDADGGVAIYGYLSAEQAAILKARTSMKSMDAATNGHDPEDKRTLRQQRIDHLINLIANAPDSAALERRGVGSLVISMTLDDILNMSPDSTFPTNTGVYLDPAALHRLGAAITDFFVLHDKQGKPLSVGSGQRTATLEQRIALFAGQLVCQRPGCGKPLDESDIHHIIAHSKGGLTDLENECIACWNDHPANNDEWDGANNMGHFEYDPDRGRPGWRAAGSDTLEFNESADAQHAAGAKIRRKYSAPHFDDPPEAASPGPIEEPYEHTPALFAV